MSYYENFFPNLSGILAPLHRLLQKKAAWNWTSEQEKAFQEANSLPCLLVHFDPDRALLLACDASPYAVGAVLSHRMEDGTENPDCFLPYARSHQLRRDIPNLTRKDWQ